MKQTYTRNEVIEMMRNFYLAVSVLEDEWVGINHLISSFGDVTADEYTYITKPNNNN